MGARDRCHEEAQKCKMGGNGFKERPITKEETDMKFKALDLALAIAIFLVLARVLFNGVVGP